jgi:hypothetical protein
LSARSKRAALPRGPVFSWERIVAVVKGRGAATHAVLAGSFVVVVVLVVAAFTRSEREIVPESSPAADGRSAAILPAAAVAPVTDAVRFKSPDDLPRVAPPVVVPPKVPPAAVSAMTPPRASRPDPVDPMDQRQ